jgi:surfeit locus 1 family protein
VLGAAVATAIAFAILVALGIWQIERLAWKQRLLAGIDAAERAPPVALGADTPALFTRVHAAGRLRPERALYGAEVRGMHMGAQAVQVLDRPGQRPLLVVLGWVPTDPPGTPSAGPADITGYIRLPEPSGWLSAADDPPDRRFYALDPATIGPALGAPDTAPFTLVALGAGAAPGAPQPADSLPRPVNNHLQYALTWFGLAAALLGVFAAWAVRPASRPAC